MPDVSSHPVTLGAEGNRACSWEGESWELKVRAFEHFYMCRKILLGRYL